MAFIEIKNIKKSFDGGQIRALRGVDLEIEEGEFLAIMGPSGSGKTTLMNIIGALDVPDSGRVKVNGKDLSKVRDLSEFRSEAVGYIFQLHNLIPGLTVRENIQVPMLGTGRNYGARNKRANELLKAVGLGKRKNNLPTTLSGGERQRVAVARSLANEPKILIADEPTSSLDSKNEDDILRLLKNIHEKQGVTIVMVTHSEKVASFADKTVYMLDGAVVNSKVNS